jgi:hypothetical protein
MSQALHMEHATIETKQITLDYPRTSAGFQCFVSGTRYASNKELIEHLVKGSHGGIYDTGSPQEAEDARRCRIII